MCRGIVVALVVALGSAGARVACAFELSSAAFKPGETIPVEHTCDGPDRSPPLEWNDPPKGTKRFALIVDDPDAPVGTWVHWVIYDLPASVRQLPEGVSTDSALKGGRQGTNSFRRTSYGGPCPPGGAPHRYFFRLYALDAPLGLAPGATQEAVMQAAKRHTRAHVELMGTYGRD